MAAEANPPSSSSSQPRKDSSTVRDILGRSMDAVSFPALDTSRWYATSPNSASSSLSCLSLPPQKTATKSKIPLPNARGAQPSILVASQSALPRLKREASSPPYLIAAAAAARKRQLRAASAAPPVPPKPSHIKVRRDLSLPYMDNKREPVKRELSSPFHWRPPRPRREASSDSLTSCKTTGAREKSGSRIPVWRGSQDCLMVRSRAWDSCAEVSLLLSTLTKVAAESSRAACVLLFALPFLFSRRVAAKSCWRE